MSNRVCITGLGLVTPLGHGAWPTFRALLAGRTITDRLDRLPPHATPLERVRAIGSIAIAQHVAGDPAAHLAELAVREALADAGVLPPGLPTFLGTSKGAIHTGYRASEASSLRNAEAADGNSGPDPADARLRPDLAQSVALGFPHLLSTQLATRLPLDIRTHVVAACASSLIALHRARQWLLHQPPPPSPEGATRALVVTAEAALLPPLIASYERLGVLAEPSPEGYHERPLDERRAGFVLAEAASAVVLERVAEGAATHGIELAATAEACEALDPIRSSPDMPALQHVVAACLDQAGVGHVDVIHPHAPGTREHDPAELAAIAQVLGVPNTTGLPATPDTSLLYAHKGALGHSLGSAGLTSLVLACLCLRTGRVPPMPWLTDPMPLPPSLDTPPPAAAPPAATGPGRGYAALGGTGARGTHLITAAGFAGHTAAALLQNLPS